MAKVLKKIVINGVDYNIPSGGGSVDDTAFSNSRDGETWKAPSQNAVYDKITSMDTDINNKITAPSGWNVWDVLKKTANGTEWGTVSIANPITLEYVETVDITFSNTLEGQTFPRTYNYLVYVVCIPNYSNIYTVWFDIFQNTLRSWKQSCKNVFLRPWATIQYDTFNGTWGSVTVKCYVYKATINT